MEILKLSVPKTARFIFHEGDNGKAVIFLHGYGMNAERVFSSLEFLAGKGNTLVVPEGLSRFYASGSSGKVVASWMTKEERLDDIKDNVQYLNMLLDTVTQKFRISIENILVVGYSQGAATAARWVFSEGCKAGNLVLWGSLFPPDLGKGKLDSKAGRVNVKFLLGDKDEYVNENDVLVDIEKLNRSGIEVSLDLFEGIHVISENGLFMIDQYLSGFLENKPDE